MPQTVDERMPGVGRFVAANHRNRGNLISHFIDNVTVFKTGNSGIEAEKLEKMKTFLSETPVSLDRPISDEDGRRLIDVLVDPNEGPAVPDQMASTETQSEMLKFLSSLKPIEADILRKRFGLVNDRERTLKEIGDEYRLSRERVRQLQEQALVKMRRAMAKRESV